jgi:hypothetical protein
MHRTPRAITWELVVGVAGIALVADRRRAPDRGVPCRCRHLALVLADAVIVGDRIGRVIDAIAIGLGFPPPVAGAVLQEGIDVAVSLNALRARQAVPT